MLIQKEFPAALAQIKGNIELTCPICGYPQGMFSWFPDKCRDCGALFQWKVIVSYKKEDSEL